LDVAQLVEENDPGRVTAVAATEPPPAFQLTVAQFVQYLAQLGFAVVIAILCLKIVCNKQ
jgi:hypothetical protein